MVLLKSSCFHFHFVLNFRRFVGHISHKLFVVVHVWILVLCLVMMSWWVLDGRNLWEHGGAFNACHSTVNSVLYVNSPTDLLYSVKLSKKCELIHWVLTWMPCCTELGNSIFYYYQFLSSLSVFEDTNKELLFSKILFPFSKYTISILWINFVPISNDKWLQTTKTTPELFYRH